jgi:hypothetical protein
VITLHLSDTLLALLIGVLLTLHYVVYARRISLQKRISQLESLNAALGLRFLRLAAIVRTGQPPEGQRDVDELTESIHTLFRQYQAGGLNIAALGDVTVSGDVVGGGKTEGRRP